jgi:putative serine protease XkdF
MADEPMRLLIGIAYQAGPDPRITKGADGGRDYFTADELEKAAHSYLINGPRVGLFHVDGTDQGGGQAQVVESYIYRNDEPWVVSEDLVVRKGDWVLGAILSPKAWQMYLDGKISGWSPQGTARRRRARQSA